MVYLVLFEVIKLWFFMILVCKNCITFDIWEIKTSRCSNMMYPQKYYGSIFLLLKSERGLYKWLREIWRSLLQFVENKDTSLHINVKCLMIWTFFSESFINQNDYLRSKEESFVVEFGVNTFNKKNWIFSRLTLQWK